MKLNSNLTKQAVLGVFVAMAFTLFAFPASAHAQQQICGNGGTGYCLNNWNAAGTAIKMYNGGNSHEDFQIKLLSNMCNGGLATSTCPINVPGLNLSGRPIVSVQYYLNNSTPTALCVATDGNNQAVFSTCPDTSGNGGGNGTIMVWQITSPTTGACPFQESGSNTFGGYLVDRYWSNLDGQQEDLFSGGNPGVQAFFGGGNGTCWGGL